MFIFNNFSTCFGHHYAHLQENKTYVTARGVLRWFCWMWLVAVVGRCVVGCYTVKVTVRTVTFTVLAPHNAAPNNRYQPHPAEPAQHNTCSNIRLVLLKMGIMMPETCREIVKNEHLTVASCWFSLSLHNVMPSSETRSESSDSCCRRIWHHGRCSDYLIPFYCFRFSLNVTFF